MKWSDEQREVLKGTGNMLVSASAGSGKTAVVAEYVIRLLRSGEADLNRILVITFTRAAAAELRNKLVEKMYEEVGTAGGENVAKQFGYLPFAHIETVDGFCAYLMRKYFAVAGKDPAVTFGDEMRMKKLRDECFDRVTQAYYEAGDEEFARVVRYFRRNRRDEPFREAVYAVMDFADKQLDRDGFYKRCLDGNEPALRAYYLDAQIRPLQACLEACDDLLALCRDKGYDRDEDTILTMRATLVDALEAAEKDRDIARFFSDVNGLVCVTNRGKKGKDEELTGAYEATTATIGSYRRAVEKERAEYEAERTSPDYAVIKRRLTLTAKETSAAYERIKNERKLADIRDGMDSALTVLRDPEARAEVRASFDRIFVDEYQDTDYRQEEMIRLLDNGNLFLVGDVKQSIFQWRSAEPEIVIRRMAEYAENTPHDDPEAESRDARRVATLKPGPVRARVGTTEEEEERTGTKYRLNTNFRSTAEILDFTNRVCEPVITDAFCRIDYSAARLRYGNVAENVPDPDVPPVQWYTYEPEGEGKEPARGVYSVRDALLAASGDAESEFVAQKILWFREHAGLYRKKKADDVIWKTADEEKSEEEPKRVEPVSFGDVAVLLRSRSGFRPIADALTRNGIPFYTADPIRQKDDDRPVFRERETLVDILRVCVDASDDVALYNALSSPVGGFSDGELVEICNVNGTKRSKVSLWEALNLYNGDPKLEKKIRSFVDFIDGMRCQCAYRTAEELLNAILSERFDAYLLGKNEEVLAELNAFVSFIAGTSANASAEAFLSYYDEEYEGNKPPARKNAVLLMTMHASKGLQFPIVFLPFLHRQGQTRDTSAVLTDAEFGLAVNVFDEAEEKATRTLDKTLFFRKKTAEAKRELARLMYVAFTRAENYLVLSGRKKDAPARPEDAESMAEWIEMAAAGDPQVGKLRREMPVTTPKTTVAPTVCPEDAAIGERFASRRYRYRADTGLPVKFTVSQLAGREREPGEQVVAYERAGDRSDAARGTAVHAVMQYISYDAADTDAIEAAADEMVREGRLTPEERALVPAERILRALRSDVIGRAKKNPCVREQPFLLYMPARELYEKGYLQGKIPPETEEGIRESDESVLVQGVIDLLIDEGDGYVVVDFKTGGADAETLANRYRKQLELYAEAVVTVTGKPVKERLLYAVDTDRTVPV